MTLSSTLPLLYRPSVSPSVAGGTGACSGNFTYISTAGLRSNAVAAECKLLLPAPGDEGEFPLLLHDLLAGV